MALLPGHRWLEPDEILPENALLDLKENGTTKTYCQGDCAIAKYLYMVPITPFPGPGPKSSKARCLSYIPQETSLQAHESQKEKAPSDLAKVFAMIGTGSTCDELEVALLMSHQTTSARVRDLAKAGKIVDSGRRRLTRTGRKAIVWAVVEKGPGT